MASRTIDLLRGPGQPLGERRRSRGRAREPDGLLALTWDGSCAPGDLDYQILEGDIGDFDSHTVKTCTTEGSTSALVEPGPGNTYYLVVPTNEVSEGSYGIASDGTPRLPAADACLPQCWAECVP